MTRAAIYARYSSDKQSDRSAEDQARLCRERAAREGWQVVEVYADLALSGATRNRPGLNALLADVATYDVVIAESIDRLSRDQEDIAAIFKRLRFAGVRLITLSEGEVGEIHIGLGGTMAALYLKQLGEKTRRGQIGRVDAGRIPGGISYGYQLDIHIDAQGRADRGRRRIDPDQAAIIRRIFDEVIAGISPRRIAERLNREGVPGPTGAKWSTSTIIGNVRRGTGILHNALYDGRIVYNRQRFEKHPVTRKRIARPNPPEAWLTKQVPELRIVAPDVWRSVQARFAAMDGVPASHQRRPKRLFSGLVKCGQCGGSYTIVQLSTWGCSNRQNGRGCTNTRTISNAQLEQRVLTALRDKMLAPELIAAFIEEFHRTLREERRTRLAGREAILRRRDRASAKLDRYVAAIGDGTVEPAMIRDAMRQAAADRDAAERELAEMGAEDDVVTMHPGLADVYRRKIADLSAALADIDAAHDAREQLRDLIEAVVATPAIEGRGVDLALQGRLAAILALTQEKPLPRREAARLTVELVAGTGFEPVTFRL